MSFDPAVDGSALAVLRRINANRPPPVAGERCEMCAEPIADQHSHVVNLGSRNLLCTCRGCHLLFTDDKADLRYRAVPDRYLSFPGVELTQRDWDDLQIPVGLAFLFTNSVQNRTVAFYPGPAGATESELALDAWERIKADNPSLGILRADVEALLVQGPGPGTKAITCHLVPIDACYELVGGLRQVWRGFEGGREAQDRIQRFFAMVADRSRPAPAVEQRS